MRNTIWLALSEAKCIGSSCRHPVPCARRDIAADPGRPMADFSLPIQYLADCCAPRWYKHIPYAQAVRPVDPPKPAKEWIGNA